MGTAATTSLVGHAAASARADPPESLEVPNRVIERRTAQYRSIDSVKAELESRPELLEAAAEAGYLEEASLDALDLESIDSEEGDAIRFDAVKLNGEVVPEIRIEHEVDEGLLTLVSRPEHDQIYAYLNAGFKSNLRPTDNAFVSVLSCSNTVNGCVCLGGCQEHYECECYWSCAAGSCQCNSTCTCVDEDECGGTW